mmetsp:Transcript_31676/g.48216  ORF Transcript_31676/g.48216 Transcript_31676/m.48216 type:complete len:407 (-) Transcript_31676:219-1439(-)
MWLLLKHCLLVSSLATISGFTPHPGRKALQIKRSKPKSGTFKTAVDTSLAAASTEGKESTLYDVLGGSMNDTHDELRLKYTNLAKKLHPDAQFGQKNGSNGSVGFTDINAAWQILGDATERRRYDRKLKAKEIEEIAQGVGSLLKFGFDIAVPIFQKTAETTIDAADKTSKAVVDVSQKVGKAMDIFELDQESRGLEKRAQLELARAKKLKQDIEQLPKRRLGTLQENSAKLTSAEASRLEKGFGVDLGPRVSRDIKELETIEKRYEAKSVDCFKLEKESSLAEKQNNDAKSKEQYALQRLEEAKRELSKAKKNTENSYKAMMDAQRKEKNAELELEKISGMVQKVAEKVRSGLRSKEEVFLSNESLANQKEITCLENSAKELILQAKGLKKESIARKRQQSSKKP